MYNWNMMDSEVVIRLQAEAKPEVKEVVETKVTEVEVNTPEEVVVAKEETKRVKKASGFGKALNKKK